MRSAVQLKSVKKIAGLRILHELEQILDEPRVVAALQRLDQFDLLKFIDPQLRFDQHTANLFIAAERASGWFDLLYTGKNYRRWILYLLCLFENLSERGITRVTEWLCMSSVDREMIHEQLPKAKQLLKLIKQRRNKGMNPTNSEIYFWFDGLAVEVLLYLMACSDHEGLRKWISLYMTDLRKEKVILNGDDLISRGFKPGRYFQDIFEQLLKARLNQEISTREEEIDFVKKKFPNPGGFPMS
jgi:tRNA nucleotidyltransferase (CCA-adding enzyme)